MLLSKSKRWNSFLSTLLASCESRLEALSQTSRAVRTQRSGRRDPTGSNKPDSDSASRPSGEMRGKTLSGRCCSPPVFEPVQHDVIQHLIASERILGISMAIGPRPEFFENPGGLPGR